MRFNSRLAAYSATAGAPLLAAPAADATIQNIAAFSYDKGATFVTTTPDVSETPANHNTILENDKNNIAIEVQNETTNIYSWLQLLDRTVEMNDQMPATGYGNVIHATLP